MSISVIQNKTGGNSGPTTSGSLVMSSDVTAGNSLLVAFRFGNDTNRVSSISDTLGNTFSLLGEYASSSTPDMYLALYVASNISGGANTISFNTNESVAYVAIAREYSGLNNSNAAVLDVKSAGDKANSTTITSTAIDTTNANDLILAIAGNKSSSATISVGSGYGNFTEASVAAGRMGMEDKEETSSGSYTASVGQSSAVDAAILVFSLKAASGPSVADLNVQVMPDIQMIGGVRIV